MCFSLDPPHREAAEVACRFQTENEKEMMRCLMAWETGTSKADLVKFEALSDKALDVRRRIGVEGGCCSDLLSLQSLMTFEEGKPFTDMQEAGGLLLKLVPILSPERPLGPWLENYQLFRQSGGIFEPEARISKPLS